MIRRPWNAIVVLVACAVFAAPARAQMPAAVPPDHAAKMKAGLDLFKKEVRSILLKNCVDCHGGKRTKGGLDLTDRKPLFASGTVGADARASTFFLSLTHEREPHMPHKAAKLPAKDIAAIGKWIDLGAPFDAPLVERPAKAGSREEITADDRNFWSFRPLQSVEPPAVKNGAWVRTPVDRFILSALEAKGLRPNRIADKQTLIRRVTFDLIGLPPTPAEIDAFVADADPNAYEKVIDRLLASPHYGERWARHWMDVARFGESHGYEQDYDRPHAYTYRDFLIKAFNADLPYDAFVKWQIAGDEFAPNDPLALTATGFLGGGAFPTQITEVEFESARYDELDDMTATTGVAFLGLSVGCARCHDHKYDPFPSSDYYRIAAAFTSTIRSEIDVTLEPGSKPVKAQVTADGFPRTKHHSDERGYPHFYPQTFILDRGDVHRKKAPADAGYLRVLMRNGKEVGNWRVEPPTGWTRTPFRRTALANWLTDIENGAGHLSARVIVNRLWQHHFGRGIVGTPNDFGAQGDRPTHPELLDRLALDLIRGGWKLKPMHKLMVTSAVYMQSADFDEERARIDRENMLHWRRTPRRLEAEPIRDAMLAISGTLDTVMHGRGTLDPNMRRRSVYFFIKRSQLIPTMMLFDWPEHLVSIGRRANTTIAPQALMFLNGEQTRKYAEGLAKRLEGKPAAEATALGYRLALGRAPTERESVITAAFLSAQAAAYKAAGKDAPERRAMTDFCRTLFSMNEFVYVD
jgi:cytochrome c553